MLSAKHISTVKSTIPLLESAGTAITEHFYKRMFKHNPELKHIFNLSHQHSGGQPAALFNAVAAYAKNIDNLGALSGAVERIAHKHTSFNIQAEHYPIVGHHLLETLRELAPDAFTAEVEEAWAAAYGVLAGIFIDREATLYHRNENTPGGWKGARQFEVVAKTKESDLVTSFTLAPTDKQAVIDFESGQYLGISVAPINHDYQEIRQYSLSDKPNGKQYRISVKKEAVGVPGVVSNYLHEQVNIGDKIDVYPPAGDFHYEEREAPVVLISAGVGVTPMQSMLEMLAAKSFAKPVFYLHACESVEQHSFNQRVEQLGLLLNLQQHTWYRDIANADEAIAAANIHQGFMNLAALKDSLPLNDGDYYLCGPVAFMQFAKQQLLELGVSNERIHYEVFGPHSDL
ncbi:NO-inducible flavohemoprotein [Shewanella fidelis]|uniref:Flavohemoprotein n=1 Tax=Shewanella fidelis TaxID=173509 RepID=A0AAW8NR57_9GAMM|nr:NO-inducible flavohemoprotein [Shewanella fidelis]MDR8525066.1 NO-inducible flavohemoprotein [Shewanella fidelis]MDW4811137.1 NO-inducible flavohemoprotein [Shewanella fidelis]MDW4815084.1 NO-inducible flavohemoprotein [Shewanella fidelis]MDW4819174.1 NO-inducible flavohemoprotein [Shewanella fidelis]MDW4823148.1 NO-inducible flavohemoprotein [Shewanella fidelis]